MVSKWAPIDHVAVMQMSYQCWVGHWYSNVILITEEASLFLSAAFGFRISKHRFILTCGYKWATIIWLLWFLHLIELNWTELNWTEFPPLSTETLPKVPAIISAQSVFGWFLLSGRGCSGGGQTHHLNWPFKAKLKRLLSFSFNLDIDNNEKRAGGLGGSQTKAICCSVAAGCLSGSCYLFGRQSFSASCCCGGSFCFRKLIFHPSVCLSVVPQPAASCRAPSSPSSPAASCIRWSRPRGPARWCSAARLREAPRPPTGQWPPHLLTHYGNNLDGPQQVLMIAWPRSEKDWWCHDIWSDATLVLVQNHRNHPSFFPSQPSFCPTFLPLFLLSVLYRFLHLFFFHPVPSFLLSSFLPSFCPFFFPFFLFSFIHSSNLPSSLTSFLPSPLLPRHWSSCNNIS